MTRDEIDRLLGADVAEEIWAAAAAVPMSPAMRDRIAPLLVTPSVPRAVIPDRNAA